MQTFTGWEYLLIDLANHYGLDKLRFDERIKWAEAHLNNLEDLIESSPLKERPLFQKTIMSVRKAQQGKEIGHLVGFDAICSGMQIMSTLTGCIHGAQATGLVDPDKRADAYTEVTKVMDELLGYQQTNGRKAVKTATMTTLYGSKAEPKKLYGEDTPELEAFYDALMRVAPGAVSLLDNLQRTWKPFALAHSWRLPDNHYAHVPVMAETELRIEVDELAHATFTYLYRENQGQPYGISNAANVIHSIDAYVLRCLERRCNYDLEVTYAAYQTITDELLRRHMGIHVELEGEIHPEVMEHVMVAINRYNASKMADVVVTRYLTKDTVVLLSTEHLEGLLSILQSMAVHEPFPIITVHDEFKCHPNNMNYLRQHYINIFAEMADAELLSDIFTQLMGQKVTYKKGIPNLSAFIRKANYPIC